jgi:hypothetical protein
MQQLKAFILDDDGKYSVALVAQEDEYRCTKKFSFNFSTHDDATAAIELIQCIKNQKIEVVNL